jgi:three-Cys-motif partner protein
LEYGQRVVESYGGERQVVKYDKIGYWSEVKLEIIRKYATAYSTIMARQTSIQRHVYIDAFAGAGVHISKRTGEFVLGSPLNALLVSPPFSELHFIDLDGSRVDQLREIAAEQETVHVFQGDCNTVLLEEVFPRCRFDDFRRALCLLDPYGLHLNWEVVLTAGKMRSVEIFLNFPVMDMNMNVLWHNPEKVAPEQAERMNAFWGDESWLDAAYSTEGNLFNIPEKTGNQEVADAFRRRLVDVAGFPYVPPPMPMRNTKGAVVYYLFFASPNRTGGKIVTDIFRKYRDRGAD